MSHTPRLLIVDDEPLNIEILLEYLEDGGYELDTAEDGQEAWEKLEAAPDYYDVVILDRMMPRMNGMEVLSRIKAHPVMQSIPVILQTALAAHDEILEGIQAGAWYYLTKPFEEDLLRSVLGTAIEDRMRYRRMQEESSMASRTFGLLHEARFRFRTLESARDLATMLANACPQPGKVVIGLSELLINAVEHGNLGITYDEKSVLREEHRWEEEVTSRLQDPVLGAREVEVCYLRGDEAIEITITDEGDGFDWQAYLDMDPARAFDTHGRGIAMSRMISFERLEYRGCGNEVVAIIELAEG
ncbi:response regulator [endosymbiont of unidentified scaly snail isolate Monju]|uniref:response regulator n=1 Tax=endosymbiont of unidentified scaly snail isolate Monju TaxID=1248727 RepID=UPI0005B9B4B6|nr:response regulator [endosymbiont of unidentified scaly snail isolate Monju]